MTQPQPAQPATQQDAAAMLDALSDWGLWSTWRQDWLPGEYATRADAEEALVDAIHGFGGSIDPDSAAAAEVRPRR